MLVAKRDPFHSGAHDASTSHAAAGRFARAINALQIVGTLLAVPAAIGSAYSMYRTNFSVEATCQSLRSNIVAMLDKGVDADARHMLVRRDVEAFQAACGAVDPDATAAFKVLLANEKKSAPVLAPAAAPVAIAPPKAEAKSETVARKAEPRPDVTAKQPTAKVNPVTAVAVAPARRDDAVSDTLWLDAVRQALVNHVPAPARASEPAKGQSALQTLPGISPKPQDLKPQDISAPVRARIAPSTVPDAPAPPMSLAAPIQVSAPVAHAPAPQTDDGHPVPPEAIPDANPADAEKAASRSRIDALIAKIPFVGSALER
jgi:hypothetical protein